MKIVTWNCNGSLRTKYQVLLQHFQADIYIIQECENPDKTKNRDFQIFVNNYHCHWVGHHKNKGLAIFSKQSLEFEKVNAHYLRHFVPFKINDKRVIAVWAMKPYIEEMVVYFSIHETLLGENTIIIGDFNSNVIWDRKHKDRSHSTLNSLFKKYNLSSVYHMLNGIEYGQEVEKTFYMYRKRDKAYHIDYVYCSEKYMGTYSIGEPDFWLNYSDHMPILSCLLD